jgi:hypothetical protein
MAETSKNYLQILLFFLYVAFSAPVFFRNIFAMLFVWALVAAIGNEQNKTVLITYCLFETGYFKRSWLNWELCLAINFDVYESCIWDWGRDIF